MKQFNFLWCIALGFLVFVSCKKDKSADDNIQTNSNIDTLRMNQIQVIASHNSYRQKTYQPIFDLVQSIKNLLPPDLDPDGWDYDHLPFYQQFSDYNVRGLEIDIYNDPQGGNFSNWAGKGLVSEPTESNVPALDLPGFKVLHVPDLDYLTHYWTFKSSLEALKQWSDQNPRHVPLFIYIETKSSAPAGVLTFGNFANAIPYDMSSPDALDEEIKSVFGANLDKVITPDDVRGNYNTLEEAVLAGNWPQLKEARGKVVFVMSGGLVNLYTQSSPSLQGRASFVFATPGKEEAAFIILNSSVSSENEIKSYVGQGYIVRTRADSDTQEARNGDYSKLEAALRSGAQIISTDYYKPDARAGQPGWTDFKVQLPDGKAARINPVSAAGLLELGVITE